MRAYFITISLDRLRAVGELICSSFEIPCDIVYLDVDPSYGRLTCVDAGGVVKLPQLVVVERGEPVGCKPIVLPLDVDGIREWIRSIVVREKGV